MWPVSAFLEISLICHKLTVSPLNSSKCCGFSPCGTCTVRCLLSRAVRPQRSPHYPSLWRIHLGLESTTLPRKPVQSQGQLYLPQLKRVTANWSSLIMDYLKTAHTLSRMGHWTVYMAFIAVWSWFLFISPKLCLWTKSQTGINSNSTASLCRVCFREFLLSFSFILVCSYLQ